MQGGKGLRPRDLLYLSSWTPSLSTQLTEEEDSAAEVSLSLLRRQGAEKEQRFTGARTPLGVVGKAVEQVGLQGHSRGPQTHSTRGPEVTAAALSSSRGTVAFVGLIMEPGL